MDDLPHVNFAYSHLLSTQVFSGTTPLGDAQDTKAIYVTTRGERPQRPTHPYVTGGLWKLIQQSWGERPHSRPEASEILQVLRDSSVPHLLSRSLVRRPDHAFTSSNPPAWKRLISPVLPPDERIGLITSLFSDCDELETFKYLHRRDAQVFVDVIDEVSTCIIVAAKGR